jgi:hypothetical protein
MSWKNTQAPPTPDNIQLAQEAGVRKLTWSQPGSTGGQPIPRFFAVYRVKATQRPDWTSELQNPKNLLAVIARTDFTDSEPTGETPFWYAVTAISPNSVESTPATPDMPTATRELARASARITRLFPNPFSEELQIEYRLEKATRVNLWISNAQGQQVIQLVNQSVQPAGSYEVLWQPGISSGRQLFFIVLETNGKRITKKVVRE